MVPDSRVSTRFPCSPKAPCSLVARVCAFQGVAREHLDPTSQQLHQRLCKEALISWSSSHSLQVFFPGQDCCPGVHGRRKLLQNTSFHVLFCILGLLEQIWSKLGYLGRLQCPQMSSGEEGERNSHILLVSLPNSALTPEEDRGNAASACQAHSAFV